MQKKHAQNGPSLSLPQQAYVLASSLRSIIFTLAIFLIFTICYFSLGILVDDPLLFLLLVMVVISPFLIFTLIKTRRFYKELNAWNEQYLESSYTLIFDTTVPKGSTTGEKILSLASLIFPQLRQDYLDYYYTTNFVKLFFKKRFTDSWEKKIRASLNYKVNREYHLDVALKTLEGYFIIKDFGDNVVSVKDIKDLIVTISDKFRNKYRRLDVLRMIVVAKDYDPPFFNRESLEQLFNTELKSKLKIDLIVQEEVGYTVLWVS